MSDEEVLRRWLSVEASRINDAVAQQKPLSSLLREEKPHSVTKRGEIHRFDKKVLVQIAAKCPENLRRKLRLPINIYFSPEVEDSCYLTDAVAVEFLQHLDELNPLLRFRDGKLWLSKPIALNIIQKYRTAAQIVIG